MRIYKTPWSALFDEPHGGSHWSLTLHIVGAIAWMLCIAQQLISGGMQWESKAYKSWHRIVGWITIISATIGVVILGGYIWVAVHDFLGEYGNVPAGTYTFAIATATVLYYAVMSQKGKGQGQTQACCNNSNSYSQRIAHHKDYMLMALI
jgi:hypothetical protein